MKAPKVYGNDDEQRQRISDELRQLKQMSKGLRSESLRAHKERHAAASQHPEPRRAALPVKPARAKPARPRPTLAA